MNAHKATLVAMLRGMGNIIRFMLFRVLGGRFALALAAIGFLRSRRRSSAARITPPRR